MGRLLDLVRGLGLGKFFAYVFGVGVSRFGVRYPLFDRDVMFAFEGVDEGDVIRYLLGVGYGTVVVGGAGYGEYVVTLARKPSVRWVYAFEPNPYLYQFMMKVIALNEDVSWKVRAYPHALTDKGGYVGFVLDGTSSRVVNDGGDILVKAVRLDDVGVDVVGKALLFLDVEGHELQVLEGAKEFIARHSPDIMLEVWNTNREKYYNYMNRLGYRPIKEFRVGNDTINTLFVRKGAGE